MKKIIIPNPKESYKKDMAKYGKKGADLIRKHPRVTKEDFERLEAIRQRALKGIKWANKTLKELKKLGL